MKILQKPNLSLLFAGLLGVFALNMCFAPDSSALGVFDTGFGVDSLGLFSGGNEAQSSDPFPTLLYNRISDGETLWGHDGKGIVFADSENLVNGNPQFKTAQRGDTLNFSVIIKPERYYDDAETEPIIRYMVHAGLSTGLTIDQSSVVVKIGNQIAPTDSYFLNVEELGGQYDLSQYVQINIPYTDGSDFVYPEGAEIEVLYSALIGEDAPSLVSSRNYYTADSGSHSAGGSIYDIITNETEYQATAILDGAILIRRVDENDNPLPGAKFAVDGVKAAQNTDGTYRYDENGEISEFTADSNGVVIIENVPFGTYTARELTSPAGHRVAVTVISKNVAKDISLTPTGKTIFVANINTAKADITSGIVYLEDGSMAISRADLFRAFGDNADDPIVAEYNASTDSYVNNNVEIKKGNDQYVASINGGIEKGLTYDANIRKNIARFKLSETMPSDSITNQRLEFNGSEAILTDVTPQPITLSYNSSTGCYYGEAADGVTLIAATVCEEEGGYQAYIEERINNATLFAVGQFFVYSEERGYYVVDSPYLIVALENVVDQESATFSRYLPITYSRALDKHFVVDDEIQWPVEREAESVYATEFLFRDKTDGVPSQEDINNPQTSDTVVWTLAVIAAATAATIVGRKKLLKR